MATIRPRRAGILIPTFAVRTEDDLGIGDTGGVRELIDWAADTGLGFLQFLPINATGTDSSPYNAISSVALDYLTLDLHPRAVPELDEEFFRETAGRFEVEQLRSGAVQYLRVRELKGTLLRHAFGRLRAGTKREGEFAAFREAEGAWLEDFCLFRVLMEENGHEDWTSWPETLNTAAKAREWLAEKRRKHAPTIDSQLRFHAYVQWLCFSQWRAVRAYATSRGVKLMGDVPFGISWCSSDVFFQPEQFDLEWCGGAPPETYFKEDVFVQRWGQNWGIPIYRWDVMEADDFRWWRRRVGKLTEVFDIFRIDHVLGFYRIYSFPWRPRRNGEFVNLSDDEARARTGGRLPHFQENDDDTHEHRAANLSAGDRYLRMIVEAAAPYEVVAEDLGTVPDYVRPHLLGLDVPGFKICQWEPDPHGNAIAGSDYDNCAFTTYATHDHEPMKTHWEHRRRDANTQDAPDHWLGQKELRLLASFAGLPVHEGHWPPYDDMIRHALLEALLASNARFAAFMLTDLFALEERFNVPGIESGVNWSARMPMTVRQMRGQSPWKEECAWLAEVIRRTGRKNGASR
jgi:4-alpha-glucanotransferase